MSFEPRELRLMPASTRKELRQAERDMKDLLLELNELRLNGKLTRALS